MATLYYRPYTAEPIKDGDMPPLDAMDSILPEYQYIFVDPEGQKRAPPPREYEPLKHYVYDLDD